MLWSMFYQANFYTMRAIFFSLKACVLIFVCLFFCQKAYCAVDQILNDVFFQNPAELSLIQQTKVIVGNVYITPQFKFVGSTTLGTGNAVSQVNDHLPYLLASNRLTDKFVLGVTITPSAYGHLDWPVDSIVANEGTITNLRYYRIGPQASYQYADDLAIGVGVNLAYNRHAELDFVISGQGNQINKVTGYSYTVDLGLLYKINKSNSFTAAVYSPVNQFEDGISYLGPAVVNDFSLNIVEAVVAYVGLKHLLNDRWFIEEKAYWSGWSLEKSVDFNNSVTGSFSVPADWKNVWSFQALTRYAATEKTGMLGSVIFETNPVSTATNQIGYPLAPVLFLSAGLDIVFLSGLSMQLFYGYGTFIPKAQINNSDSKGSIVANIHAVTAQFTYKV